jgi:phage repressor protein C with HTH and peptisase S24 domain
MEEVARKLSVNSEWLKTGEGPKDARHLRLLDETGHTFDAQAIRGIYTVVEPLDVELPFYKETATAPGSNKTHVVEDPGQSIRLPRSHLDSLEIKHTDAICARMIGNSMGERIEDGSFVGIDRGLKDIIDGEIYAIEHDGMLRIKYLHRVPGNAFACAATTGSNTRTKSSGPRRSKSKTFGY